MTLKIVISTPEKSHREVTIIRVVALLPVTLLRPPNGSHVKLRGRGPRAEVRAARCLPTMTFAEPSGELQAA